MKPTISSSHKLVEISPFPAFTQQLPARVESLRSHIGNAWSLAIKGLVENKHLYQKVTVDWDQYSNVLKSNLVSSDPVAYAKAEEILSILPLGVEHDCTSLTINSQLTIKAASITALNVSIYCPVCSRKEAAKSSYYLAEVGTRNKSRSLNNMDSLKVSDQHFAIVYVCQCCEKQDQAFLIERTATSLRLVGRSPIEGVEVPRELPKIEAKFMREAFVARNSGKILAGLFYLRTFIEQYVRRITEDTTTKHVGDVADEYGRTIPESYRAMMPSLREIYELISVEMHAARDNEELFEKSYSEILHHFEFRRLFKLYDVKPKTDAQSNADAAASKPDAAISTQNAQ
jgi:hypothetical protein